MGKFENHKKLYLNFKEDAEREIISKPSRAELYFLSIFHLIEACAAKFHIHINKHQKVRYIVDSNPHIFGKNTETVWRLFQNVENKIRPKFSYGFSWTEKDFKELRELYLKIELICSEVLEDKD